MLFLVFVGGSAWKGYFGFLREGTCAAGGMSSSYANTVTDNCAEKQRSLTHPQDIHALRIP